MDKGGRVRRLKIRVITETRRDKPRRIFILQHSTEEGYDRLRRGIRGPVSVSTFVLVGPWKLIFFSSSRTSSFLSTFDVSPFNFFDNLLHRPWYDTNENLQSDVLERRVTIYHLGVNTLYYFVIIG